MPKTISLFLHEKKRIITFLLIVAITIIKLEYYIADKGIGVDGFFSGNIPLAFVWITCSLAVSISPYVVYLIFASKKWEESFEMISNASVWGLLIANIVLEMVSAIGGAMCQDSEWLAVVNKMFFIHIVFAVLLILQLVSRRKNSKS